MTYLEQINKIDGYLLFEEIEELVRLAQEAKDCIVEIGSYKGKSTIALAYGSQVGEGVPIYAIDPHDSYIDIGGGTFKPSDSIEFLRNIINYNCACFINIINLPSDIIAKVWYKIIDLLFIDGDHTYNVVRNDFENWKQHVKNDGCIVMHDSNWPGPARVIEEAEEWNVIKKVGTLSILRKKNKECYYADNQM